MSKVDISQDVRELATSDVIETLARYECLYHPGSWGGRTLTQHDVRYRDLLRAELNERIPPRL